MTGRDIQGGKIPTPLPPTTELNGVDFGLGPPARGEQCLRPLVRAKGGGSVRTLEIYESRTERLILLSTWYMPCIITSLPQRTPFENGPEIRIGTVRG